MTQGSRTTEAELAEEMERVQDVPPSRKLSDARETGEPADPGH